MAATAAQIHKPAAITRALGLNKLHTLFRRMGCVNGRPALSAEDLDFIARNTAVSREEVDQAYGNFLEKHPDGKISKRDFSQMMKQCYPNANTEKLEKHIFRIYDTNNDGDIDFREFMIVLYVLSNGSPEENLKQIYRVFDINNDGSISKKELKRIVKDLFHLLSKEDNPEEASQETIAKLAFAEMDTNEDGKITQEEFVRACMGQERISSMLALRIIDVFVADSS